MKKRFTRLLGWIYLLFMSVIFVAPAMAQSGKTISVEAALNSISKKYNAKFAYEHEIVQGKTTDVENLKAKNLDEVLKRVLYPNNLLFLYVSEGNYTIVSRETTISSNQGGAIKPNPAPGEQEIFIQGQVTDENGGALPGATIKANMSNRSISADANGKFSMLVPNGTTEVYVSYLGYESKVFGVAELQKNRSISLKPASYSQLEDVNIVSNGYQSLPKERSTGAFSIVTAEDLKKTPVANLIQRLETTTPGVKISLTSGDNSFVYGNSQIAIGGDTRTVGKSDYNMQVRGTSTYLGESFPLIVVDGAITQLDISTINPNDVENITFLKDAAAASIWGTRAANGVMVITTKRGINNQAPTVSFSATAAISSAPNLDYLRTMNSAQTIEYERELVDKGLIATPNAATALGQPIADATDLYFKLKAGTITQAAYQDAIDQYTSRDSRDQIKQYFLQPSANQQYNLAVRGGGNASNYFYSASYSKERPYAVGTQGERLTITLNNTFKLFKKATLTTSIKGAFFNLKNNGISLNSFYSPSAVTFMPYNQVVDDNGNRVQRSNRYYSGWQNTLPSKGFLNWGYNALDELDNADNTQKDNNYSANINLNVPIVKGLSATGFFGTERTFSKTRRYYNENSYYYRDQVNLFTPLPAAGATTTTNSIGLVPGAGILSLVNTTNNNYNARAQLNYDDKIGTDHQVTMLAGTEIRQTIVGQGLNTYYGYNMGTGISRAVNYFTPYATVQGFNQSLSGAPTQGDKTRRYLSYFANAAYTYKQKYSLTASARYDDYNNFGVDRKFRATPLWSGGFKWDVSKESFLKNESWISNLSLRTTYGVNGNISTTLFPFTYISIGNVDSPTGLPTASIIAPANPELRWEKTYVANIGLDFGFFKNRLNGTVDVYNKKGRDLYFSFPLNGTYGFTTLTRNSSRMTGNGVDLGIGGTIIQSGDWELTSRLNYSYNTNKVEDDRMVANSQTFSSPAFSPTISGYPTDRLFVYQNAGLDANGLTLIYDETGKKIPANQNITSLAALKYAGRTTAPHFGSLNTALRYKDFTLMAIATYQFGSVFLKPTISGYPTLRNGTKYDLSEDVALRWRKAGDELTTNVPGVAGTSSPVSLTRYMQSDINVLKGDYIRLRELSLSYRIPVDKITKAVKTADFGFAVRNLGLLWTANKEGIDPDFTGNLSSTTLGLPATVSYSFSLNVNF
ncbi:MULTISPECIES: SusC/RagA family TonB-linked outer membrane protein [unclassified Pedobacter]|uniref:SusC/RagA family TonB-linked outer membrane protein n=1 Tax=unclassified Pedobacter TaxID=2628915 RepID=UPI0014212F9A|nr:MULTISPECIES: SusC/RagA family TonB-linked outer membrane protein [unclassified Pedobacter]NII81050.1 TonB-linked SusC/RagA family outer membrane protein [Pedobacter sp. SG908]NMN35068.1 TonB-linked SusC/RagA family outer membrane protein [Pedobacter sp. SG918]